MAIGIVACNSPHFCYCCLYCCDCCHRQTFAIRDRAILVPPLRLVAPNDVLRLQCKMPLLTKRRQQTILCSPMMEFGYFPRAADQWQSEGDNNCNWVSVCVCMDVRKETFRSSLQHNDSSVQPTDRSGATSLRATQVGVEEKKTPVRSDNGPGCGWRMGVGDRFRLQRLYTVLCVVIVGSLLLAENRLWYRRFCLALLQFSRFGFF